MRQILPVFLIVFSLQLSAQNFNKKSVDSLLTLLELKQKWMGNVALMQGNKLIYSRAIGYADIENKVKSNTLSKYRIGSITKVFTTTLVLHAIEKGKIKLDSKLSEYFPEVEHSKNITISMLLQHRSGIKNYTDLPDYNNYNTKAISNEGLLKNIVSGGSEFKPDSKAEYSNSNFLLLAMILEKIYSKTYSALLDEIIIKPLGLKNTYKGGKINIAQNECNSYQGGKEFTKVSETDMSVPLGAGDIVSTAQDICLFDHALFSGKIITDKSLGLMKEIRDGYGRGLFEFPFFSNIGYGHTGGIDGFSSVTCYFPKDQLSVAIVSNGNNFDNNEIGINVLSAWYGRPYEIPSFEKYKINVNELSKFTGEYFNSELNMVIKVSIQNDALEAQAEGQGSFALEATNDHSFQFIPAGLKMIFDVDNNAFTLRQGGGEYKFIKK